MVKASNKNQKRLTLNPYMRGKIMGARDFGISFGQIAAKYKIPCSTVSGVVYRADKQYNGKKLSRPVRPKVLMENDKHHVLRIFCCLPYS